jgi:hypothetical protein
MRSWSQSDNVRPSIPTIDSDSVHADYYYLLSTAIIVPWGSMALPPICATIVALCQRQ